jgi:hypothetical protein
MTAPARICVYAALATGLAFLPALLPDAPVRAEEGQVLERFEVARDGDVLLLPVTFRGKTYRFGLDSAAKYNVFDTSLPLGDRIDEIPLLNADGPVRLRLFAAPEAKTGGLNLKTAEPVAAFDFAGFREALGGDLHGALGLPFFRRHVVRVDFDKGELLVLKEPGRDCGRAFAVTYNEQGQPLLRIDLGGGNQPEFTIATGSGSWVSLAEHWFDITLREGGLSGRWRRAV